MCVATNATTGSKPRMGGIYPISQTEILPNFSSIRSDGNLATDPLLQIGGRGPDDPDPFALEKTC
jgi:hypothetical protein